MKTVFKNWKKYRLLTSLERALNLDEDHLKKYLDSWESKMPEPSTNLLNSNSYAISSYGYSGLPNIQMNLGLMGH